jgi:hypothetical protein
MKKYELNLKENEELIVDVDDTIETELVKFKRHVKKLNEKEIVIFDNWVKIYKLLNYDIIGDLTVEKVYKFNDYACAIELSFRGQTEFDMLHFNPGNMTVSCMNVKENKIRNYVVRRLLIPNTVEEALSFAKSVLPEEGIKSVKSCIDNLEKCGEKFNVTNTIKINESGFIRIKDENKQEEIVKENEEELYVPEENHSTVDALLSSIRSNGTIDLGSFLSNLR